MVEGEKHYPIGDSADGKKNAYYTSCMAIAGSSPHDKNQGSQRKPYAACLKIINSQDDADVRRINPECMSAISKGRCVAIDMREEELSAGRAIYFLPRTSTSLAHREKPLPQPKPLPQAPKGFSLKNAMQIDYGAAISEAVVNMQTASENLTPKSTIQIVALPGESPLATARRIKQEQLCQSQQ